MRGVRDADEGLGTAIQGGSEKSRLPEDEVQQAIDFCGKLFGPIGPD